MNIGHAEARNLVKAATSLETGRHLWLTLQSKTYSLHPTGYFAIKLYGVLKKEKKNLFVVPFTRLIRAAH